MKKKIQDKKKGFRKVSKWLNITLWCGFFCVLLFVVGVFYALSTGRIGYVPPVDELENPIDRYASQIISSDGVWLGSYSYEKANRISVKYNDLSPALVQALIATEDIRFTKHSGIDIKGLTRAIIKRIILNQKSSGGGSTITQQLAKQLYSPPAGNTVERMLQKPIEWVIATRLEKYYTKEEIITLYLDKFDFLYNAVGIQTAARTYFNTTPKELKIEQAATLVGMCKNPSLYNPRRYNERAQGRRNTVLSQMRKYGFINAAVCDSLSQLPVELIYSSTDHKEGPAPYYREYLRQILDAKKPDRKNYPFIYQRQRFIEDSIAWETNPAYGWCQRTFKANGQNYNLYTDGLIIYTTLDSRMQKYAEEAVKEHVGKFLQPAFDREKRGKRYAPFTFSSETSESDRIKITNSIIDNAIRQSERYKALKKDSVSDEAIDANFKTRTRMSVFSWNGYRDTVMTPIDSIRYMKSFLQSSFMAMEARTGHVKAYVGSIHFADFQYDMVTQGRRQIGSTMKPFVYSLAMSKDFTPCTTLRHEQPTLMDENNIPWRPATSSRDRIGEMVTLAWGLQVSSNWMTASVMNSLSPYELERLLRTYGFKGPIDPVISMCLGTPDISVAEMVSAYSVFTNKGMRIEPIYITHIEDSYGNIVATFTPQTVEVLDEDAAYKVLNMLQNVVESGTAAGLRARFNIKAPMGGKTGTSQDHSDAWFIGFTPSLVAGCWVGGDNRYVHFDSMDYGQGARAAMPVYANFMQKVLADKQLGYSEKETFDIPEQYINPCSPKNNRGAGASERRGQSGNNAFYN